MGLEPKIVSREIIKPATPTPPDLKVYSLSLLDQLAPLVYGLQFSCYNSPSNDASGVITRLKESLSKTLSLFYPLAGRLTADESTINCNDEGIPFVEARCKFTLSSFLSHPNRLQIISHFLPSIMDGHDIQTSTSRSLKATEVVPMAVQVSVFNCGGIIIGTKGLHKILDASSLGAFYKAWSDLSIHVSDDEMKNPNLTSSVSLFPPCNWAKVSPPRAPVPICDLEGNKVDGTCVAKVFEFNPHSILALQAKARTNLVPNPTRVQAVSGFIWKHLLIAAAIARGNPHVFGPSSITHAVNMRPRTNPKLSPTAIGNLVFHAIAHYKGHDEAKNSVPELSDLVAEICRALAVVKDAEFLSKLQGKNGGQVIREYKQQISDLKGSAGSESFYRFTSWIRLGIDQEFGLGMRLWSGHSGGRMSSWFKNLIHLIMNTTHGVEVWLILDEKEMDILQSNPEFLEFASLHI